MAANGYLVIALNHQDGTCFFTIDQNGKDLCYQKDVFEKKELREKQIKIRAEEVIKVIEELRGQENGTSTELFGKEVRLDMDQLVLAGHSFGGATMIKAANDIKKEWLPSSLVLMDPWPYPLFSGIEDGSVKLRCPTQFVNSETFHFDKTNSVDYWAAVCKLMAAGEFQGKQENLRINGTFHEMQMDLAMVMPMDLCLSFGQKPRTDLHSLYQLHMNLMLVYLDKLDNASKEAGKSYFDPAFSIKKVKEAEEANTIIYDIKL